jgi:Tfp pilus assembly protein PilO
MQFPRIKDIIKISGKEEYAKYLAFMPDLKQERTKKFTTIVLTLTASIILGLFAITPTLSTIANLQKQIDDDKFVDEQLQRKINALSVLQQKYANVQNDLPVIHAAIPTSSQIPPLVAEIQTIAKESNLKLTSFQTFEVDLSKSAGMNKKYSSFDFGFSGEGSYSEIINFMDKLVTFQRIIIIENVSISRLFDIKNTSGALQLSVKGTAFFKQ